MPRYKNVPSIYYTVINLLAENPKCRDNDQYLVCKVWLRNHPKHFTYKTGEDGIPDMREPIVELRRIVDFFESTETITRARREIQNTLGLYPPTSLAVAKARRIKYETWRENLSNNFTKEQAKAIMEIYIRAKDATKKNLVEIKRQIIEKYKI